MENTYSKRPLWQWVIIYLLIGGIAYGVIYYVIINKNSSSSYSTNTTPSVATQQKFLDSALAKNAFQIYPGDLSADAKNATAGFTIKTQTLPDGSTQVNLTSTNSEYQSQQYTVMPGYTLYFIEKNPVDDSATDNSEKNLQDDSAVLVDTQGFQVQP